MSIFYVIFPRASERRVLLIVGSVICVCHTSSHLHVFTSSHKCFTSYIFTYTHVHHIFTYMFTSYIFTYTHPHTHICTYAHLHILFLHLHIFTYSHLHILTSSHLTSSHSHLHIFTSSHTHIFTLTSSHLSLLTSLFLSLSLSLSPLSLSPFSLSFLLFLSLFRPRAVPARSHETSTLSHKTRFDAQKLG